MTHEHEEEAEGEDTEHDHGSCDPHVWMDPLRMAEAARLIAAELEEIAPGGSWGERAEAYATQLTEANDEIVEILSAVPEGSRKLVTNHEALGYLADVYDFEIVGVVIPGGSTLGDPSSAELAELVEVINAEQVPAIFTDLSSPSGLAEAVAEEAGSEVAVVGLYTESIGEPGSGADTLIGMLTTNAQAIADALS
jgi:zinc/manganese transport system substrate-binding protein